MNMGPALSATFSSIFQLPACKNGTINKYVHCGEALCMSMVIIDREEVFSFDKDTKDFSYKFNELFG